MFVATPNTMELVITAQIGTNQLNTVLYAELNGATTSTALESVANTLGGNWILEVLSQLSDDVEYLRTTATDISQIGGAQGVGTIGTGSTGGSPVSHAPLNVNLGIKKSTGRVGRAYWGYLYQFGLTEAQVASKIVDPVVAVNIANGWDNLKNNMTASGNPLVHRQKQINGVQLDPYQTVPIVSFDIASLVVATTKRRLGDRS